jgi:hypothetical protein
MINGDTQSCKKCGSIDLSIDLETNNATCLKCNYVGKPSTSNIYDINRQKIEEIKKLKKGNK